MSKNRCAHPYPSVGRVGGWLLSIALLWSGSGAALPRDTAPDPNTAPDPGSELGIPFLRTFSHRDYDSHPQNWTIVQDPRGVLFVGNTDGVLEFDGDTWRRVQVSNRSIVRSLAVDAEGTVYVGAVGELGRLSPDAKGQLVFESLVAELPAEHREFTDIWRTLATTEAIYFWTPSKLLRWQEDGLSGLRGREPTDPDDPSGSAADQPGGPGSPPTRRG